MKDNLKELLNEQLNERQCRIELNDFYNKQLKKYSKLKYIYKTWISENNDKIRDCNIEIDYLRSDNV